MVFFMQTLTSLDRDAFSNIMKLLPNEDRNALAKTCSSMHQAVASAPYFDKKNKVIKEKYLEYLAAQKDFETLKNYQDLKKSTTIKVLQFFNRKIATIHKILLSLFPCLKNKWHRFHSLGAQAQKIGKRIETLQSLAESLKAQHKSLLKKRSSRKIQKSSYNAVKELFGGEKAFKQLPALDIGNRTGTTGYIDFIRPDMMSAPVMRGKDAFGRRFFVIRAEHKQSKDKGCQAFFERYTDSGLWVMGGRTILSDNTSDYMAVISSKGSFNAQYKSILENFLKNRGDANYDLV